MTTKENLKKIDPKQGEKIIEENRKISENKRKEREQNNKDKSDELSETSDVKVPEGNYSNTSFTA